MKKPPFILSIILPFLLLACSNTKETEKEQDERKEKTENKEGNEKNEEEKGEKADPIPKVRLIDHEEIPADTDPFSFEGMKVEKGILRIMVSYSGGCEEHSFDLFSSGDYTKSDPPSVDLFLRHDANGDACRSVIMDSLRFDVSQLKHEGSKKVLLKFRDHERPVEYAY